MSKKWNYFFVLGLSVDPPPKAADIQQAVERKKQEWTADLQDFQKREAAERWLAELPSMRVALLMPSSRMELAREANQIRKEKLAELRQELAIGWHGREITDSDIAALINRYPYSIQESDIRLLCKELALQVTEDTSIQSSKSGNTNIAGAVSQSSVTKGKPLPSNPVSANVTTSLSITAKKTSPAEIIEEQVESLKATLRRDYRLAGQLPPKAIQDLLEKYPALTSNIVLYQFQAMKQEQDPKWQAGNHSQASTASTSLPSDKQSGMSPWIAGLIAIGIMAIIFFILLKFLPWWGAGLGTVGIIALLIAGGSGSGGSSGGSIGGSGLGGPRIGG